MGKTGTFLELSRMQFVQHEYKTLYADHFPFLEI